jgi:hypothetical protein
MLTVVAVELTGGAKFQVEGEVHTILDLRRLMRRADEKFKTVAKVWPEVNTIKIHKVRIGPAREQAAPSA